jgi:UDP-glucose 6-dehydrogenase
VAAPILEGALEINATQPARFVQPVIDALASGARVAVLGAAFKPDTDDVRESPTLTIVPALVDAGLDVVVHDPIAIDNVRETLGEQASYEADLDTAIAGADAIVVVTRWKHYDDLPERLAGVDPQPLVADGRRMYAPDDFARYTGVGRPS